MHSGAEAASSDLQGAAPSSASAAAAYSSIALAIRAPLAAAAAADPELVLRVSDTDADAEAADADSPSLPFESPFGSPVVGSDSGAASPMMHHGSSSSHSGSSGLTLTERLSAWLMGFSGNHAYAAVEMEDRPGRTPHASSAAAMTFAPPPPLPRRTLGISLALLALCLILTLDRFVIRRPYGLLSWHQLTSRGLYQGAPGTGEKPQSCGWDYEASWKIGTRATMQSAQHIAREHASKQNVMAGCAFIAVGPEPSVPLFLFLWLACCLLPRPRSKVSPTVPPLSHSPWTRRRPPRSAAHP